MSKMIQSAVKADLVQQIISEEIMFFRNKKVDGFFVIHTNDDSSYLTNLIEQELNNRNATMEDVQFSTHIKDGMLFNDVLVMYTESNLN